MDVGGTVLGTIFVDVLDPLVVIVETVGRDADHLDVAPCKVARTARDLAELGGADGGEISGVGEEDGLQDRSERDRRHGEGDTQESPIHSWKLIGPAVVTASKLGVV